MKLSLRCATWKREMLAVAIALGVGVEFAAGAPVRQAANFNLTDLRGRNHELRRTESKAVVLCFTGVGCPIARKSGAKLKQLHDRFNSKGIEFWVINTFEKDTVADCRKEYEELELWPMVYLRDPHQGVAFSLGVQRTAEVVVLKPDGTVQYQGAIDDQLAEGADRAEPQTRFLEAALDALLANEALSPAQTRTPSRGCRINYAGVTSDPAHVYSQQVAPLLQKKCVVCHREGGIGPFAMDGHSRVKNYARMIEEVLLTHQMPPWHADPEFGKWANDRSLSADETMTLLRWISDGAPRGEGSDPLAEPIAALPEWRLGNPDFVVKLPKPETIPATGVLDYRHIEIKLPTTNEMWLRAADVKPGNRKVVHHVIVRAKWPGGPDDGSGYGINLTGWAPGMNLDNFPEGTGKFVAGGATIDVEMHYTTMGSPQTDQTEIAFYLLDSKPERELITRSAINTGIEIPPGVDESRDVAVYGFRKPATVYSLMPHMHLRGKWMKFELLKANGKRETLLNVPRYDFNWQTVYKFAKPLHLPAGSWLMVTGGFDKLPGNPANPDSKKRIHFGLQSWDEMFIGFLDVADDAPSSAGASDGSKPTSARNDGASPPPANSAAKN